MLIRSNDGRPLRPSDIPEHPDPLFDQHLAISAPWSFEWNHPWGRALRRYMRRLGWRPSREDRWVVTWS
jgi:hypothetical protein